MINSVVEVLIIEFFIRTVELSNTDAKPDHEILFLHERGAVLHEPSLLVRVRLPRVERAQDDAPRRAILEKAGVARRPNRMLGELSVKIVGITINMLTQLLLLQNVGELLAHQVRLLLVEDVHFRLDVIKPGMSEHLSCSNALLWISLKQALDQFFGQVTQTDKV